MGSGDLCLGDHAHRSRGVAVIAWAAKEHLAVAQLTASAMAYEEAVVAGKEPKPCAGGGGGLAFVVVVASPRPL